MPGGELHHWPICAVCSETWGEPTTVEEYEVPADSVIRRGSDLTVCRFQVIARCSHGRGFKPGTVREQRARVDVPEWWGKAHMDAAISLLTFFVPGAGKSPDHGMVTRIG
jgi:hypothetical protein